MFKLKFFILFALAILCFGDTRVSESGSGNGEGEGNSSGADTEKNKENTNVRENNGENKETEQASNSKEKEGADDQKGEQDTKKTTETRGPGHTLPEFIGGTQDKKNYVLKLLQNCNPQYLSKVNENDIKISFKNCTYTCTGLQTFEPTKEVKRIPENMTCGENNMKCPKEGDCPTPPLPAC
uniref:Putative ixodes 8-cys protein n=1 Tax=Ixodes ricinus TaxID=34613 RepID=A0A0K8RAP2_IXORI